MARPDPRRPRDGQHALFDGDDNAGELVAVGDPGPIELAAIRALEQAADAGYVDAADAAAAALVVGMARAADGADGQQQAAYQLAKLAPAMTDLLDRLHMTPESRRPLDAGRSDAFAELLEGLADADTVTDA